eukprot:10506372-Lingulodinium_polyedra.AAC.1
MCEVSTSAATSGTPARSSSGRTRANSSYEFRCAFKNTLMSLSPPTPERTLRRKASISALMESRTRCWAAL